MIRLTDLSDENLPGYRSVLDAVAKERQFLFFLEAPSIEQCAEFVEKSRQSQGVCLLAMQDEEVVGWCDISRYSSILDHSGQLGVGLLAPFRGRGVGRRLMEAAMDRAWDGGFKRIELAVFARNARALALYEKLGFVREGTLRDAACLDGSYLDVVWMGALRRDIVPD